MGMIPMFVFFGSLTVYKKSGHEPLSERKVPREVDVRMIPMFLFWPFFFFHCVLVGSHTLCLC